MSNASRRAEGATERLGGKIKGAVGKVIGNRRMQAEGKAAELAGAAKQQTAKAAARVRGKAERAVGSIKNRVGVAIGDEQMEMEGLGKAMKGDFRERTNR